MGFPAIAHANARVLVLGSLPGRASLEKREYYAQPQNVFWKIMGEIAGAGRKLPYEERLVRLMRQGIALWDVVHEAERTGSLDADIRNDVPNDFADFFRTHTRIEIICFNGAKAAELYELSVLRDLAEHDQEIPRVTLPSTSPAHSSMRFEQKLEHWRAALLPFTGA